MKNLETRPLWHDEERVIKVNTIRCYACLSAVEPIRKDDNGKDISFVKPGNNHHIAIYADSEGNLQESVCSFWHAVQRKLYGFPVIIQNPKEVWDTIINKDDYPQEFLEKLPTDDLTFQTSMQQNEMFIIGLTQEELENAINMKDYRIISKYLYRVQKLSTTYYVFRNHLETKLIDGKEAQDGNIYVSIRSMVALKERNPIKVKTNVLGEITMI